jgi:hypothetical protein
VLRSQSYTKSTCTNQNVDVIVDAFAMVYFVSRLDDEVFSLQLYTQLLCIYGEDCIQVPVKHPSFITVRQSRSGYSICFRQRQSCSLRTSIVARLVVLDSGLGLESDSNPVFSGLGLALEDSDLNSDSKVRDLTTSLIVACRQDFQLYIDR